MLAQNSIGRDEAFGGAPTYRAAPHNVEVEQALIGAILLNNEAFYRVSDFLEPRHFFEPVHQRIFELSATLIRAGKLADVRTLKTFLPPDTDIAGLTVSQYLARLATEATGIINAGDYGQTIRDLAIRRSLIAIGEEMVNVAYDAPVETSPRDQIETAERRLYELAETGRHDAGFISPESGVVSAMDMMARAYQADRKLSGIPTGFEDIDRLVGGLHRSDLVIIAGRPGMGKTALATNIAYSVAQEWRAEPRQDGRSQTVSGGIVGFFSLEMSGEQLWTRIISEQTGISSYRMRHGQITPSEFERVAVAARGKLRVPLWVEEAGGLSIAQLTAKARRLKRQRGLDMVVVDYLQLLHGSTWRARDRVQEVTEITTGLKALAKELNVPVLALSQLSRRVESQDDKRPQLADLRESGSIEQDADIVLFVFREEYYLKNKEPRAGTEEHLEWQNKMDRVRGKAEVIVAKHRHGPTGTVQLQFKADVTKFGDLANDDRLPERRGRQL